jgi:hypothetical protein
MDLSNSHILDTKALITGKNKQRLSKSSCFKIKSNMKTPIIRKKLRSFYNKSLPNSRFKNEKNIKIKRYIKRISLQLKRFLSLLMILKKLTSIIRCRSCSWKMKFQSWKILRVQSWMQNNKMKNKENLHSCSHKIRTERKSRKVRKVKFVLKMSETKLMLN